MAVTLKHNKTIRVKHVKQKPKSLIAKKSNLNSQNNIKSNIDKVKSKPVSIVSNKKQSKHKHHTRELKSTKSRINNNKSTTYVKHKNKISNEKIDSIRKIGENKILIIIGNGPSHKEVSLQELKNYDNIDMMTVNKPDDRVWPTEYWAFCDNSQYNRHKSMWNSYNGLIVNSSAVKSIKDNCIKIKSLHGKGFSTNLKNGIHIGRSSTYFAIQVGIWMGYDHIYVFGCDMSAVNGKLYPWGSNPDVKDEIREKRFKNEADHYNWMANKVNNKLLGKLTFCTSYNKWPFIQNMHNIKHEDAVQYILSKHVFENQK